MKAKVIETGEIVDVTPYPTWYKENGQGPDRREWDEDELEFIRSGKKVEEVDLEKEYDNEFFKDPVFGKLVNRNAGISIAKHFFELGLTVQKGE